MESFWETIRPGKIEIFCKERPFYLSKNTMISPNVATKLAEVFGYENWQDMLEDFHKKERRKAKPVVSKDWKEQMEARVAELEKALTEIRQLIHSDKNKKSKK